MHITTPTFNTGPLVRAIALAVLAAPFAVMAQTTPAAKSTAAQKDTITYSDNARMKPWTDEKGKIEALLPKGLDKAAYLKKLTDAGYQITAVLKDDAGDAEYEIVKGGNTWEVDFDFDKAGKATSVDVSTNLWQAEGTEAALAGKTSPGATAYVKGNERYSDKGRMKVWSGEKERLEKTLSRGQAKSFYAAELKKMGYQITSTNENEKDKVEYEVVKGSDTYEVQIDFDSAGKSKDVHVSSNMWKTDATKQAMKMK